MLNYSGAIYHTQEDPKLAHRLTANVKLRCSFMYFVPCVSHEKEQDKCQLEDLYCHRQYEKCLLLLASNFSHNKQSQNTILL